MYKITNDVFLWRTVREKEVAELLLNYGQIDGAHHKTWVIDQALRILLDSAYGSVIDEYTDSGKYDYDTGIAP